MSNVLLCIELSVDHLVAEIFEHRLPAGLERRKAELLDAEQPARLFLAQVAKRIVRANLRPMTADRLELSGYPVSDVDDECRRLGMIAECVWLDVKRIGRITQTIA